LFAVTPERGFLPRRDPILHLPRAFDGWEEIAGQLPKLLVAGQLRRTLDRLAVIDVGQCGSEEDLHRAMLLLSYFAHGYVWGSAEPASAIPASVAIPWHRVAQQLGRPPVLSYASYALYNWRRVDPAGPIALGNIVLCQNFLGGVDEEWFVLVHVEIEGKAAAALAVIARARQAVTEDRAEDLTAALSEMATALEGMGATLARMPERCDPYIYFHRVRPYLYGWKDHPALPEGLVYQGVEEHGNRPQKFRGETGAQSTIIPALDAVLGISHATDPLRTFLLDMRQYMPPQHREMLEQLERNATVRPYVLSQRAAHPSLRDAYNQCVRFVERFRSMHLQYAARYIQHQSQRSRANLTNVGTGGTPFIPYLKKHRDETTANLIN
jgi:indoleamine 2,3-dioxygenase